MIAIKNMDTGKNYYFTARTPYEAMRMMREYLSYQNEKAKDIVIQKTESNRFLYFIFKGETYSTRL